MGIYRTVRVCLTVSRLKRRDLVSIFSPSRRDARSSSAFVDISCKQGLWRTQPALGHSSCRFSAVRPKRGEDPAIASVEKCRVDSPSLARRRNQKRRCGRRRGFPPDGFFHKVEFVCHNWRFCRIAR